MIKKKDLGRSGYVLESRNFKLNRGLWELRKFRWQFKQLEIRTSEEQEAYNKLEESEVTETEVEVP